MVNFVSPRTGEKLTITLSKAERLVGNDEYRFLVVCEIWSDGSLIAQGMSMCHPTDTFDPRKGSHIALTNTMKNGFDKAEIATAHKIVDSWFK